MSESSVSSSPSPDIPAGLGAALEGMITEIIARKRPSSPDTEQAQASSDHQERDFILDYAHYGRTFCRLGDPFMKIYVIVEQGLIYEARLAGSDEGSGSNAEDPDDDDGERAKAEKRAIANWKTLCQKVPNFRTEMLRISSHRRSRRSVCKKIGDAACSARSDDTGSLKDAVLNFLLADSTVPLVPPIPTKFPSKAVREWSHPVMASLLCPMEYDANDMTYAEIKAGRKTVTADQWPRFCYPDDQVYTPDDEENGLLRGHLLVRCAKHIFTGPSSALNGPGYRKGRAPNAGLMSMTAMTPRAVAYAAVQARFAISDVQDWSSAGIDRKFNLVEFFWNIVALFDDGEGSDILQFYDTQLFGTRDKGNSPHAGGTQDADVQMLSASERIKAQRQAKKARLAAETAVQNANR